MARRRGPSPKDPEDRARRNPDPVLAGDGWTEIADEAFAGDVPPIPEWITVSDTVHAFYAELARLPVAVTWGPNDWLMLHASLPLLDRYFARPGSESYKAWTSFLDPGLRITSDAMQKARVRIARVQEDDDSGVSDSAVPADVTDLSERRRRLTS